MIEKGTLPFLEEKGKKMGRKGEEKGKKRVASSLFAPSIYVPPQKAEYTLIYCPIYRDRLTLPILDVDVNVK